MSYTAHSNVMTIMRHGSQPLEQENERKEKNNKASHKRINHCKLCKVPAFYYFHHQGAGADFKANWSGATLMFCKPTLEGNTEHWLWPNPKLLPTQYSATQLGKHSMAKHSWVPGWRRTIQRLLLKAPIPHVVITKKQYLLDSQGSYPSHWIIPLQGGVLSARAWNSTQSKHGLPLSRVAENRGWGGWRATEKGRCSWHPHLFWSKAGTELLPLAQAFTTAAFPHCSHEVTPKPRALADTGCDHGNLWIQIPLKLNTT